jgi:hypothetical protein
VAPAKLLPKPNLDRIFSRVKIGADRSTAQEEDKENWSVSIGGSLRSFGFRCDTIPHIIWATVEQKKTLIPRTSTEHSSVASSTSGGTGAAGTKLESRMHLHLGAWMGIFRSRDRHSFLRI